MRPTCPAVRPPCAAALAVAMIVVMSACAGEPADDPPPAGAATPGGPEGGPGDGAAAGPGDDVAPVDGSTLAGAVAATRAVERARVELRITVAGPAGPVTLVHGAAFTDGGLRARASSDMTQAAAALEAAGQHLDGDWSHPTGVVVDGDVVYSQLGPMAEALGRHPDDWVRARLDDVTAAGAENDALALALDPLGPLDLLYRPVREVAEVATSPEGAGDEPPGDASPASDAPTPGDAPPPGDRPSAGEPPLRHLRATLDLTGTQAPPAASFEGRLAAAGVDALPVDVWLDGEGRVRRLVVSLDDSGALTATFVVDDVGAGIEVVPPDPAEVIAVAPPGAAGDG